jgi:hypothetical protein
LIMGPLNFFGVQSLKQSLRRSLRQHQWDSNTIEIVNVFEMEFRWEKDIYVVLPYIHI